MGWAEFALAFGAFLASHSLPVRPRVRARLVALLGRAGFGLTYSALSLAVLAWLVAAAGRAPHVPLWNWAPWQNHLTVVAMLPACMILALAIGRPNPFSFGGARNDRFDPARPGIVGWLRHPVPAALALWAGSHVPANGDLAHVLLFGSLAGFAILGRWLIDRRLAAGAPLPVVTHRPSLRALLAEAPLRAVAGAALWLGLIALHPVVIGVTPLP